MALQRREMILAGLAAAMIALVAGSMFFGGSGASVSSLVAERDRLAEEVKSKKAHVQRARQFSAQLAAYQRRSLPTDHESGRTAYQNWLLQLAERNKFRPVRVEPAGEGRWQKNTYFALPFTVRGQTNLEQLLRFLYEFYSAGNLDQIRHLTLKPVENSQDMEVLMSIEALSLPTADRRDKLTTETVKRLELERADEYLKVIAERRPFSRYKPPTPEAPKEEKPPEPEPPPKFDPTRFAYLTAVLEVDGQPEAWLRVRTTDQTFMVHVGDKVKIGATEVLVTRIGDREAEVEIAGKRYLVPLGSTLRDGKAAP